MSLLAGSIIKKWEFLQRKTEPRQDYKPYCAKIISPEKVPKYVSRVADFKRFCPPLRNSREKKRHF